VIISAVSRNFATLKHVSRLGLKIEALENDNDLQDDVLSVHHACILTLSSTVAVKIIQNNIGNAFIQQVIPQTK